jgi:hypothetical protein
MDSVPNAQEFFDSEVPEVIKTAICCTRRHVNGCRCSVKRIFPF